MAEGILDHLAGKRFFVVEVNRTETVEAVVLAKDYHDASQVARYYGDDICDLCCQREIVVSMVREAKEDDVDGFGDHYVHGAYTDAHFSRLWALTRAKEHPGQGVLFHE